LDQGWKRKGLEDIAAGRKQERAWKHDASRTLVQLCTFAQSKVGTPYTEPKVKDIEHKSMVQSIYTCSHKHTVKKEKFSSVATPTIKQGEYVVQSTILAKSIIQI